MCMICRCCRRYSNVKLRHIIFVRLVAFDVVRVYLTAVCFDHSDLAIYLVQLYSKYQISYHLVPTFGTYVLRSSQPLVDILIIS